MIPAVVAHTRSRTDIGVLSLLLFYVARDEATDGPVDDAATATPRAILLAREAGQATDLAACLAGLAWLEARPGARTPAGRTPRRR